MAGGYFKSRANFFVVAKSPISTLRDFAAVPPELAFGDKNVSLSSAGELSA
jgi:hypothetical protein